MYVPEIYKNNNQSEIIEFIHKHGFAILVNQTNNAPFATHIPLLLETDEKGNLYLEGHVAKANPQSKTLANQTVLAIFSGAHSYISSSWYDHENVPTWNYIAVHVYGTINILNQNETLLSLKKLTDKYEKDSKIPVQIEDLSPKTMKQVKGIVAFRINIKSIEAVKKLSQNRDETNKNRIINELELKANSDAVAIAVEMKKCPIL